MSSYDPIALNDEGRDLWDRKAVFWDALQGEEGNRFHRTLVSPAVEQASGAPITYGIADATDEDALVALGQGAFDAVICTMALMDMPVIAPLYRAARRLLRAGGRLVIATAHPAFSSNSPVNYAERAEVEGRYVIETGLKVSRYLNIPPFKAMGAQGEDNAHYYYHRPLHELLGEAFAAGFVLDALEEPPTVPDEREPYNPLTRHAILQIPLVLAARFRVAL